MRSGSGFLVAFILLGFMLACPQAEAVSLNLELKTTEYINDLVFYSDGTYNCGKVIGCLSIKNPSSNDTVSDININFSDCIKSSVTHINDLDPASTRTITYEFPRLGAIQLPSVYETVSPSSLSRGVEQEVAYRADISNPGSEEIGVLAFEKEFPEELEFVNCTFSAGSINRTGDIFHWENFSVSPNSTENLLVNFKTTPCSEIILRPSNFSFTTPSFAASKSISLSAVTKTLFAVKKQKVGDREWNVGVEVEDASEFNYSLYKVDVYVSDPSLRETKLIREYEMNLSLRPGECWRKSFTYEYQGTPVFFAKVYYTIPYTISGNSMPISAAGYGDFVVNSVVLEKNGSVHHDHSTQKLKIIDSIPAVSKNDSVSTDSNSSSSLPADEEVSTKENISQKNTSQKNIYKEEKVKNFVPLIILLLLMLLGLIIWKIFPFLPILHKK